MAQFGSSAGLLVYLAFLFGLLGFLARDELRLRLLMLAASLLYILYYYFVGDRPLWDPILTNAALATANLSVIVIVVLERTTLAMSADAVALARRFDMLTPGQVRRLLRHASDLRCDAPQTLTRAGQPLDHLYYIVDGQVSIGKGAQQVQVGAGLFIGEVAFLTGRPASATVVAASGTRLLQWDAARLHRMTARSAKLRIALQAQFNRDLVAKVTQSVPLAGPGPAA